MLHAERVAVRPEDSNRAGGAGLAEGFEAFEGLLAVVEGGGHAVEGEHGGGDEF